MAKNRWGKIATVIGLWAAFGTYSALQTHYRSSFRPEPFTWGHSLYIELTYALSGAILTPFIFFTAQRFRLERKPHWRNILIHILAATVFSSSAKILWDVFVQPSKGWIRGGFSVNKLLLSIDAGFDYGVGLYWLVVLLLYAVEFYQRYEIGLVNASRLQTQLVQAQLDSLKMQLHPHFLFNTLHTISALVHEDPEAAERMIAQLSEMLRFSLDNAGMHEVQLSAELHFLDLYLAIEQIRYAERLRVQFDIDPQTRDALVPNLVLQPLVENAIRHGIAPKMAGGEIFITSARQNGNLIIRIVDNGAGLHSDGVTVCKAGVGLSATRGRLERMYGRAQSLVLRDLVTGGVEARVVMPFITEETRGTYGRNGENQGIDRG